MSLDVTAVRKDFPLIQAREVNGKPICYLDSAASSQKPQFVLDAMDRYYETTHANVHRGVYTIAEEATALMEQARGKVARFVGAPSERGIVFTKNVTEGLNLVAQTWGRANLGEGDAIVLTQMEHHANIVPWLMLAEQTGVELRWLDVGDDGHLDLSDLDRQLDGAKLLAVTAMSNVLGTLTPLRRLADAAHEAGALVVVDGAQYTPHLPTDVVELGADFYGFTGHKMCGPTGVGVLWGREDLLEAMPAVLGGGEMILDVRKDGWTPNEIPWKFEAGTPPIAEAVGLGAAAEYLMGLGLETVRAHEAELTAYALEALKEVEGITVHGPRDAERRGGAVSFSLPEIHPHDLAQLLDREGVCVRAGHHCAKPLMRVLGVPATTRASFYVYNDEADADALIDALDRAEKFFAF
jgi:cysteine desulfurase/selenocysteine lyase